MGLGMGDGEWKSHSGELGVTSDVKMDIRERIVVSYLGGIRLSQDWGQWQADASKMFLKDCCVPCMWNQHQTFAVFCCLLSALSFGGACEAFLVALLWTDWPLTSTPLSHRPFLQLSLLSR